MSARTLIILVVALGAFGVGAWLSLGRTPPLEPMERGYVLDAPRPLPTFELVDQAGAPFSERDFRGHWSLLYFGFTYCPDVCPSAMSVMAQIKGELDGAGDLDDRYYLVSVDPDRDTPERLAEYVTYFDPAFLGVTGDFAELDKLTLAAGAVYKVPEAPEDENYLVAHSSTLTLIDPEGRVQMRSAVQTTRAAHPFDIEAWVVLPDHLHCVWRMPTGDGDFSTRWRLIKARFSRTLPASPRTLSQAGRGERGIWQRRFWEHHIRGEEELAALVSYCWHNPVKHGLVRHPGNWPYSSYHRDAAAPA